MSILDLVPLDALAEVDAVACAFGPPQSGDADEVLEVVFHIDAGAAALLAAFADSGRAGDGAEVTTCRFDSVMATPALRVEYEGQGYLLGPGPDWCFTDHPEWQELVEQIKLSVVAADEVHSSEVEY